MQSKRNVMQKKKRKKMQEKMKMHERNKKIKCRGGYARNKGGAGIKKVELGQKRGGQALGPGECEPNRSGSSEPDRFRISYKGQAPVFLVTFSHLSLSSLFLERESLQQTHLLWLPLSFRCGGLPAQQGGADAPANSNASFFEIEPSFRIPFLRRGQIWPRNFGKSFQMS